MERRTRLERLVRVAALRRRSQRFVDGLSRAALPLLVLASVGIVLGRHGWLRGGEETLVFALLAALAVVSALGRSLRRLRPIDLLIKLDRANGLPDHLGSAWDFLGRPAEEQTPQMARHIERAMTRLDQVSVASAEPFRAPAGWLGAVAGLAAFGLAWALAPTPNYPPLPAPVIAPPLAEHILDRGRLLEDMRNIEALRDAAVRSGNEDLQAVSNELDDLVQGLQSGTVTSHEMLDRLAAIEESLADQDAPPEPPDLEEVLQQVAAEVDQTLDELGIPEDSPIREQAEALLDALESGDESALADAMDTLAELLEQDELTTEDAEALADLLERFSDLFDPTDIDLRAEIEGLEDQLAELEQRLGERGGRRTQRRIDQARERLGEAMAELDAQRQNQDAGGETQQSISEALQDAADSLREDEPGPGLTEERGDGAGTVPEEGEESGTVAEEGRDAPPPEGQGSESAGAETQRDNDGEPTPQDPGDTEEPSDSDPSQQQASGQEPSDPGEGEGEETGEAGSAEGLDAQEGGAESASDALRDAAEQLEQIERDEATREGMERAEQATSDLRENLQRSSGSEPQEQPDENWSDFMARAGGDEVGSDDGAPQDDGPGQAGDSGGDEGRSVERQGENADGGPGSGEEYGEGDGGDPRSDESADRISDLERERTEVEGSEDGPATSQVFRDAAADGFASAAYREVYQEYAQAAESALESEEIPVGYRRFVEQYFRMVEPRINR